MTTTVDLTDPARRVPPTHGRYGATIALGQRAERHRIATLHAAELATLWRTDMAAAIRRERELGLRGGGR